jgi:hypothetical protein
VIILTVPLEPSWPIKCDTRPASAGEKGVQGAVMYTTPSPRRSQLIRLFVCITFVPSFVSPFNQLCCWDFPFLLSSTHWFYKGRLDHPSISLGQETLANSGLEGLFACSRFSCDHGVQHPPSFPNHPELDSRESISLKC